MYKRSLGKLYSKCSVYGFQESNDGQLLKVMLLLLFAVNVFKTQPIQSYFPSIQLNLNMSTSTSGPIEKAITEAITAKLEPIHLEVVNESYMHNVPKGSETHFKVLVVSGKFESLPLIKVLCGLFSFHSIVLIGVSCFLLSHVYRGIGWLTRLLRRNSKVISCMLCPSKQRVRPNGMTTTKWIPVPIVKAALANDIFMRSNRDDFDKTMNDLTLFYENHR